MERVSEGRDSTDGADLPDNYVEILGLFHPADDQGVPELLLSLGAFEAIPEDLGVASFFWLEGGRWL
jgi:hypothetical protein